MAKYQPWKKAKRSGLDYIRSLSNERWNTNVSRRYSNIETGGGVQVNKGQIASPWATVPDYSSYQSLAALAGSS